MLRNLDVPYATSKKTIYEGDGQMIDDKSEFKVEQLEQVIEGLKQNHALEIRELEDNNKELKSRLKLKSRISDVTHAEHTMKFFPAAVLKILKLIDPSNRFSEIYLKAYSFINYSLVCGIGVMINMYVLLTLTNFTSMLWLANIGAIIVAWFWNWSFTVGPLGYLFGLSLKRTKRGDV